MRALINKSSSTTPLPEARTVTLLRDLANLRDDGIKRFRNRWDQFYGRLSDYELLQRRDELRILWTAQFCKIDTDKPGGFAEAIPFEETHRTDAITEALKHFPEDPLEKVVCDHWLRRSKHPWTVEWGKRKRCLAHPYSLTDVLALACIRHSDRFGVCHNVKCVAPYFFKRRRDQLFCCYECAWPAQKAAKLRWWKKHGSRNRSKKP
jgi:hypothetical protein